MSDSEEFRRAFYENLFSDVPNYQELYLLLEKDSDASIINYRKFGVEYLKKAMDLEIKTLVKILILRTTSQQHKKLLSILSPVDKGIFLECKREIVSTAQFNRGVLLFMKRAEVPLTLVIEKFCKLPIENRVISIKHAMGDIDPSLALGKIKETIEIGYIHNTSDEVQRGHDVASMKFVDVMYRKHLNKIQRLVSYTKGKGVLDAVGNTVSRPEDAFFLFV